MKTSFDPDYLRVQFLTGLQWWLRELSLMLPRKLADRCWATRTRIVVRPSKIGLTATIIRAGGSPPIEASWSNESKTWNPEAFARQIQERARAKLVDLEIPERIVLEQEIALPRAAGENLSGSVSFGLPTWTPFKPEEVYCAPRVINTDAQHITIALRYALRRELTNVLERAREAGITPDRLTFDSSGLWTTPLGTPKSRSIRRSKRIDAGLAGTAMILFLTLGGLVFWRQQAELATLQEEIRSQLQVVTQDIASQKELEEVTARRTIVLRKRASEPGMAELLSSIGNRLPPKAALASIEIGSGRGRIEVIGVPGLEVAQALQGAPFLSDPKLDATPPGRPPALTFAVMGRVR